MFSTSFSNAAIIASTQALLLANFAGFRKGFGDCPLLPYSKTPAIMALLLPSERGSENPTFTLKFPSLSCLAQETPSAIAVRP